MLFYDPTTNGFLHERLHRIPACAVEITAQEHAALLQAQAQGLVIQPGPDGRPEAVEHVLTQAEQTAVRVDQIKATLTSIDAASARPLRAILAAQSGLVPPDQDDVDRLAALESQAQVLRAELAGLGG